MNLLPLHHQMRSLELSALSDLTQLFYLSVRTQKAGLRAAHC